MDELKHTRTMLSADNGFAKANPALDASVQLNTSRRPFARLRHGQGISQPESIANAERIVACWNAAERANLSNEALDAGVIEKMAEALRSIAKQWPDSAAAKTARAALSARQTTDREDGK